MDKLLVIDGNSIINRAFYGTQNSFMKNAEGLPTGAVFGFLTIFFKHIDSLKPTHAAVAFDMKAPTFRHKMYTSYKGTRKPMPDDLAAQMPVLKELLDAMGVRRTELEGFEADDILGTLSRRFKDEAGGEAVILTGDRDALQLVDENISVMLAGNKADVLYDAGTVAENYGGLTPKQLIDLKALQGDSSDNIPGVPGVGPKTAIELVTQYGSLDELYAHVDEIPKAGLRQKLADNKSLAYLSKDLGRIDTNAPVDLGPDGFDSLRLRGGNDAALRAISDKLEFKRWEKRLTGGDIFNTGAASAPASASVSVQTSVHASYAAGEDQSGSISLFDFIGGSSSDASDDKDAGDNAANELSPPGFCALVYGMKDPYILIDHDPQEDVRDFTLFAPEQQDGQAVKYCSYKCRFGDGEGSGEPDADVIKLLEDANVKKVLFKSKPFMRECFRHGIDFKGLAGDLSLASYLLDSTRGSDDFQMVVRFLAGRSYAGRAEAIGRAYAEAIVKLDAARMTELYGKVELPLAPVLAKMELRGFRVDPEVLEAEGREMDERIAELQQQIYDYAGYVFNINSTKQLAKVLFEDLGLPGSKKTKSGYSTDSDVLEALYNDHPIVPCIIEYRQNAKL